MERRPDPVAESIDGATGDLTMSGDAMRWSPELAERQVRAGNSPGLDVAADVGALLGLDGAAVRRLVGGAVTSLATAVDDVVAELRQLTRGPDPDGRIGREEGNDGAERAGDPPDRPPSSPG